MAVELSQASASPVDVARTLSLEGVAGLVFFDSGRADGADAPLWSLLTCQPDRVLTERADGFVQLPDGRSVDDPVRWLRERGAIRSSAAPDNAEIPFRGGLAGMLGFEFAWQIDDVHAEPKPGRTPSVWVGEYAAALAYSHADDRWWLCGKEGSRAAATLRAALEAPARRGHEGQGAGFDLSVTASEYAARVQRAIDAIYAGEVFEINYTERFRARWQGAGFALFEQLRATSSGPYCGFLDAGDFQVCSVSPEQFLSVSEGRVRTRPIKGTRARGATAEEDAHLAEELVTSAKDRAENVMIVDLMRNDLTRVCRAGSVEATEVCGLHSFAGVHHLVSTVEGILDEAFTPIEALLASFPAGSITGAPKLRAIELITELEQTARGPYTGSLFYASRCGRLDSSVLIRTAVLRDGEVRYGAGGAVVADSQPRAEYEEARLKARPLEQVIDDA